MKRCCFSPGSHITQPLGAIKDPGLQHQPTLSPSKDHFLKINPDFLCCKLLSVSYWTHVLSPVTPPHLLYEHLHRFLHSFHKDILEPSLAKNHVSPETGNTEEEHFGADGGKNRNSVQNMLSLRYLGGMAVGMSKGSWISGLQHRYEHERLKIFIDEATQRTVCPTTTTTSSDNNPKKKTHFINPRCQ